MYSYVNNDKEDLLSYSIFGIDRWCRCPNCGYIKENPEHLPCIYLTCPLCETPMIGMAT